MIDHYGIKQIMKLGTPLSSLILKFLLAYRIATMISVFLFLQIDIMTEKREVVAAVEVLP